MTNHHGNGATLAEHVHTETAHVAGAHGKVAFLVGFKALFLVPVHDIVQEGIHHGGVNTGIENFCESAVDAENRRSPYANVQVRSLALYHFAKELFNP